MVRAFFSRVLIFKQISLLLFVCTIVICIILLRFEKSSCAIADSNDCILVDTSISTKSPDVKIRIMCVGDIMTHYPLVLAAKVKNTKRYDFTSSFEMVSPLFKQADIVIGNLETVLAGDQYGISGYPTFNGPQALAKDLKTAGFTVLTTANNHSFDKKVSGLKSTIKLLDSVGISHTGTFTDPKTTNRSLIIPVKGYLIGILSYTYGTNGELSKKAQKYINIIDSGSILKDIDSLQNKKVDIIIASVHFGSEYMMFPSEKQKEIVSFFWNNGVTIVFGHHSHILQPAVLDTTHNCFTVFSLGNFMSNQKGENKEYGGIADITIQKPITDSLFKITSAVVHPTCMFKWSENSRPRYSILLIEELSGNKLPSKYPGRMLKVADTLPFLNSHFNVLDCKFNYVTKQTGRSSDSCR